MRADARVPDGIDPAVEPVQDPATRASGRRVAIDPDGPQLRERHDPVLARGEVGKPAIMRFVAHSATKFMTTPIRPPAGTAPARRCARRYAWIAQPSTARAPSSTASDIVGCGWMMRASSG